jgi:hypothetical protein
MYFLKEVGATQGVVRCSADIYRLRSKRAGIISIFKYYFAEPLLEGCERLSTKTLISRTEYPA